MSSTATTAAVVGATVGLFKEAAIFQRLWMLFCSGCALIFWLRGTRTNSSLAVLQEGLQWANLGDASTYVDAAATWLHDPMRTNFLGDVCEILLYAIIMGAMFSRKSSLAGFSVYPILVLGSEVSNWGGVVRAGITFVILFICLGVVVPKVNEQLFNKDFVNIELYKFWSASSSRLLRATFTFIVCPFYVLVLPVLLMVGL